VLVAVAARLKAAVRITDVVARYGGDEFVVLLKGVTNVDDVQAAENKIRAIVEKPITLDHGTVKVGVSLGWTMFPHDGKDAKALLKIAKPRKSARQYVNIHSVLIPGLCKGARMFFYGNFP
jgi:diguanylate cyclase (GGDEF)-like protein